MAQRRSDIVDAGNPGVYHCVSRCVRRESLLDDPERRAWLIHRLEFLTNWMAVDVISFAIMRNHIHLLLAIRPEAAAVWTDREVAERRVSVMPNRRWRTRNGVPADAPPTETEVRAILHCPRRLDSARRDLSSLGFFHRLLKEPCARLWNKADGVTGHFWEGRFKSPRVLDLQALVDVACYIDLNEVRAGAAPSVPRCTWSSGSVQWRKLVAVIAESRLTGRADATPDFVASRVAQEDWCPVFPCRADARTTGRRTPPTTGSAADEAAEALGATWSGTALGFRRCEVGLAEYLEHVHAAGQQLNPRKPGRIASSRAGPLVDAFRAAFGEMSAGRARVGASQAESELCSEAMLFERRVHRELSGRALVGELGAPPAQAAAFVLSRGTCYGAEDAVRREAERRGRARLWVGYESSDGTAA